MSWLSGRIGSNHPPIPPEQLKAWYAEMADPSKPPPSTALLLRKLAERLGQVDWDVSKPLVLLADQRAEELETAPQPIPPPADEPMKINFREFL